MVLHAPSKTKIITDPDAIAERAKHVIETSKVLSACSSLEWLAHLETSVTRSFVDVLKERGERKHDAEIRWICPIETHQHTELAMRLMDLGIEVRHADRIQLNFSVSDKQFDLTIESLEPGRPASVLVSDDEAYIEYFSKLFESQWAMALPAERRIVEVERGAGSEETRVITDAAEAARLGRQAFENCTNEALIALASESVMTRNASLYNELLEKSRARGFRIRVLVPPPSSYKDNDLGPADLLRGVAWRRIEPINVGIAIYDRKTMLLTQYSEVPAGTSSDVVLSNIYTTNRYTIEGMASIFEALWRESELREKEEIARMREQKTSREARLLQDILAHDIRNYNQAAKLSAEMLREETKDNKTVTLLIESLIQAIDGSSVLVERAKRLGLIISQHNPKLRSIDLTLAIENSLSLVKRAYPSKKMVDRTTFVLGPQREVAATVLADDFVDEVFANLFSNSIRYTDSSEVTLEIGLEAALDAEVAGKTSKGGGEYWKVSVTDYGKGIPDPVKENIFTRYLETAKGSGLGMSIVYALVVERYHGTIRIRNRIEDDYSKGTIVEVYLPKA